MSRETLLQSSFNAGVVSPRLAGRTDFKKYGSAVAVLSNQIGLVSGPAVFRPGTVFITPVYNHARKTLLVPFKYNTEQAYILEFSHQKMRVIKNRGVIQSGGSDYEVATAYTEDMLESLSFAQDADVLYIAMESDTIKPKCLLRNSDTNWQFKDIVFKDGPYLDANNTTTTLTPAATTGSVNVTASAATFAATDIGRLLRFRHNNTATWGWAIITNYTSPTLVTVDIQTTFSGTTASTEWRLGAFSQTTGYPGLVTFHEQRIVYARTRTKKNFMWLSESQGYGQEQILFSPSASSGTVTDSNSIYFPLSAGDVSTIMWMSSGNILAVGTADGEWVVESGDTSKALSPSNTRTNRRTTHGSPVNVPAVRIDGTVMFAKGTGTKVNRFVFNYTKDQYEAINLSQLAEHLFEGKKIKQMIYQAEPFSVMWVRLDDGTLASLTFVDSEEVGGWAAHTIAGTYDGGNAVVESMAVIPSEDASYSELYMVVRRTIDGNAVRYIEVLEKPFFLGDKKDACYLDCSLKYEGAAATTITGLDHLEGEEVYILADGAFHVPLTVTGGEIELRQAAETVQVGLYYEGEGETLDFDAANAFSGSSMGQIRRISEVQVRLFETGLFYSGRADQADEFMNLLEPRTSDDFMDAGPELKQGIYKVETEAEWSLSSRLKWQFKSPFPGTLCNIMFKAMVNEG